MNNLPITMSTPPSAAKPAQASPALLSANPAPVANPTHNANPAQATSPVPTAKPAQAEKAAKAAKPADEAAPQGKSFGDVLARQVSGSESQEDAAQPIITSAKTADDIFSNIKEKTDDANATVASGNASSTLPADMLATLVAQNASSPQNSPSTQPTLPQDALSTKDTLQSKKTLPSAASSNPNLGIDELSLGQSVTTANNAISTRGVPQTEAKQDSAFSNMMESMTAATSSKLFDNENKANDDKAAALAASPLPSSTSMGAMQAATTPASPVNFMPAQVTINTPVAHDNWGDEFNQKITWLSNQKEQTAELHLNPPELGPMDVVLKVSGDQATAMFTSPHAAVREAVEQALPRLREMMAENGIMLGNATVSDQASRNRQEDRDNKSSSSRSSIGGISETSKSGNLNVRVSPITRHNGIVDTFA